MKKKILLTIMAFIGIIAIYNIKAEATFLINDFEINCNVEENGNIYIEENITYYTNENKNGLIRTINTKNAANSINSADAFILEEVMVDGASYKKTNNAYVGNKGVYTQKSSGNSNEIKVFSPFNSNTKIVTYKYILTNVAVRYNDIAELYWNFIGDEWDCEINNLEINIILPKMAKNDTVYVYGHGSDNGTFSKTGNYITLRANNLEAYQALDARILFSADALSDSTKVINRDVLSKYRNEEEGMSKKRDEAKVLFGLSINQLALGISAVILIFGIIIYVKYDKEYKVEKYKYYREIPYNLEPEILQRIYYGKNTKDAFWITFLNLIKKGIFKIEKTTNEVGKETEKIIFNKEPEKLKQYQRTVMDIIKGFMKNEEKSIDMLDLQAKMKISTAIKYSKFQRELNSEIEGLFGETKKAPKKIISALTIAMIALIAIIVVLTFIMSPESGMGFGLAMFLGMTALVYSIFFATVGNSWFTVIFLIFHCGAFQAANIGMLVSCGLGMMYIPYVLLFILIQYVVRVRKKSKEERQILEQIKGLKRYIKEYSMLSEREEITQIELWEDYFILAIALGLNNSVIDSWYEYGQVFMNSNLETSLFNVGGYSHMAMTMRPVFNTYTIISTVTSSSSGRSSYSGSRGGFSGGSSSGGRGRRRRWRKFFLKI